MNEHVKLNLFLSLIFTCFLLSCSHDNRVSKTDSLICKQDNVCDIDFNDTPWLGKQKRSLIEETLIFEDLPDSVDVNEIKIGDIHHIKVKTVWFSGRSVTQQVVKSQLLDSSLQQVISLNEVIADNKKYPLRIMILGH